MNSIINNVKGSMFIAIALAFTMSISISTVLAFGESGGSSGSGSGSTSGCCDYTPPTYTPPTYTPPTDTPPTTTNNPTPSCNFLNANKTTVKYGGETVRLTWSTSNASSASISGIGSVSLNNSVGYEVFVNSNRTYTLTVPGAANNANCAVSIIVADEEKVAECTYLNANKTSVKHGGETVTLSWSTKDATSVSINNSIGTVSATGTKDVFVDSNKTFILTAVGTNNSDDCSVSITVKPPVEEKAPRCDYLRINGSSRVEKGDRVLLEWETTNANDVRITPTVGNVSSDGYTYVTVNYDETYTLRARNLNNGQEETCTVQVYVEKEKNDKPTPRCDLEVSKTKVNRGDKVTLSWDTSNADSVRIKDDRGNTIFDTADYSSSQRKKYLDGEIDVVINRTTEFTLNARGDGGSKTCRVEVKANDVEVYEKRDQGYVIALTQVPYTGFEAGPFLTFLFYAMLTLWALFIAYVLVIKKGTILGFSLYGRGAANTASDIENRKKVEALVAKYSNQNWK